MKPKNEMVIVRRKFRNPDGSLEFRDVRKVVWDTLPEEVAKCPECGEPVKKYKDHYEHYSRFGNKCKYKCT